MGDAFQRLVDPDVSEADAPLQATWVTDRLVDDGIIAAELTDCVLSADAGHPPGPAYRTALADPRDARRDPGFATRWTNGVDVAAKRRVYYLTGDVTFRCPVCDAPFARESWSDALDRWHVRADDTTTTCTRCATSVAAVDLVSKPRWPLASFAITFWNWPPLADAFVTMLRSLTSPDAVFQRGAL